MCIRDSSCTDQWLHIFDLPAPLLFPLSVASPSPPVLRPHGNKDPVNITNLAAEGEGASSGRTTRRKHTKDTQMTRVAIAQLCSSSNLQQNLRTVTGLISRALEQDVAVLFFPEATDFLSANAAHSNRLAQESPLFISSLQSRLRELTVEHGKRIDVSIGVHLPPTEGDVSRGDVRVKNVLLYINHKGEILQQYQKLHLFDVDVPNGPILKESNSVQPGTRIADILDTPAGRLGSALCYDCLLYTSRCV